MRENEAPVISIQNLYYLLCYAWDKLEEGEVVNVGALESTHLCDLFAKVLIEGVHHLIRRGFDRGYLALIEETTSLRGKIAFGPSLKRNTFQQGRAVCEFDELQYDVLHNRILKTTIEKLVRVKELDRELKGGLQDLLRWMSDITPIPLTAQVFKRVQLHRNNRFYAFLLDVCGFVFHHHLVDETSGTARFRDSLRDERAMRRVFEVFVRNFFKREQTVFTVNAKKVKWLVGQADEAALQLLPEMMTDVTLESSARNIVVECKYYRKTLQEKNGVKKFHSTHLYQLLAYLRNLESVAGWERCEGILLYPLVNERLNLSFELENHPVRVVTLDLNQDWQGIRQDLLRMVGLG